LDLEVSQVERVVQRRGGVPSGGRTRTLIKGQIVTAQEKRLDVMGRHLFSFPEAHQKDLNRVTRSEAGKIKLKQKGGGLAKKLG